MFTAKQILLGFTVVVMVVILFGVVLPFLTSAQSTLALYSGIVIGLSTLLCMAFAFNNLLKDEEKKDEEVK